MSSVRATVGRSSRAVIPSAARDLLRAEGDPSPSSRLRMTERRLIQREKLRGVAAEDCRFVCTRDLQCGDAGEHLLQASDLMRIVAAGEDVIGAGEVDGQPQRARVEVDRIVVELLQVRAGRAVDVYAALA